MSALFADDAATPFYTSPSEKDSVLIRILILSDVGRLRQPSCALTKTAWLALRAVELEANIVKFDIF
jgi:hypothetical protein